MHFCAWGYLDDRVAMNPLESLSGTTHVEGEGGSAVFHSGGTAFQR